MDDEPNPSSTVQKSDDLVLSGENKDEVQEEFSGSHSREVQNQGEEEFAEDLPIPQNEPFGLSKLKKRKLLPQISTKPVKKINLNKTEDEDYCGSSVESKASEYLSLLCKAISIKGELNENVVSSSSGELEKNSCVSDVSDKIVQTLETADASRKSPSRQRRHEELEVSQIQAMLEDEGFNIDTVLENSAYKNKLSVTNVKTILQHIISNDCVLAMVRNTLKSDDNIVDDLEESTYEPKLTRSRAKLLREKKAQLPWPVSSPVKQSAKKLLEEEFSEEGSSRDEEYDPTGEELELRAELVKRNARKAFKEAAKTSTLKLPWFAFEEQESDSTEDSKIDEETCDEDEIFSPASTCEKVVPQTIDPSEIPSEQDVLEMPPLVIADPPTFSDLIEEDDEVGRVALRTRSKMPLTDTSLETLEASFIAPDITTDLYDTECDEEYKNFLINLIQPLEGQAVVEQVDDEKDDPEYMGFGDDTLDEWDLRTDKTTKISKKEMLSLMDELFEAGQQELGIPVEDDNEDAEVDKDVDEIYDGSNTQYFHLQPESSFDHLALSMTAHEKIQLEEQMRKHLQLLSQVFLLSKDNLEYELYGDHCKVMLEEINHIAETRVLADGKTSYFKAANLKGAIEIVRSFTPYTPNIPKLRNSAKETFRPTNCPIRCLKVKKTLAHSKVFIYPELLPTIGFMKFVDSRKKVTFTQAEDNLIALGLEQFSGCHRPLRLIREFLMTCKTEQQIKFRIKNAKRCCRPNNPIVYYFRNKCTPPFDNRCTRFDPKDIKLPAEYPPDTLPEWMLHYCFYPTRSRTIKKCYSPILPRFTSQGNHTSPMKQVIPILKKYEQRRRTIILTPSPIKKLPRLLKKSPKIILPKTSDLYLGPRKIHCSKVPRRLSMKSCNPASPPEISAVKDETCVVSSTVDNIVSNCATVNEQTGGFVSTRQTRRSSVRNQAQVTSSDSNPHFTESNSPCVDDTINADTIVENETQSEMEVCEDGEEDLMDDEQDLAALMVASSTICKKQSHPVIKKKSKNQKDLESTLALLTPDLMESDPKIPERENFFAQTYIFRVTEALKNEPKRLENFFKLLCNFEVKDQDVVELYENLKSILNGYPALIEDFVGFLPAEKAKDCGKYMEYLTLSKIRSFFRKIEVHFSQQPQQIQKILRALSQLNQMSDLTSETVIRTLQPLLRNQSHLMEEFSQLLPNEPPSESMMTDFEEITIPGSGTESVSEDSVEDIIIPETLDSYGCQDCPCSCHAETSDARLQNRSRHCVKCGTKFLDGKVFIQTGKVLKPAQIIYHDSVSSIAEVTSKKTSSRKESSRKESREIRSPSATPISSPQITQVIDQERHEPEANKVSLNKCSSPTSSAPSKTSPKHQISSKKSPYTSPPVSSTTKASSKISTKVPHLSPVLLSRPLNKLSTIQTTTPVLIVKDSLPVHIQRTFQDHVLDVPADVIENTLLSPDAKNELASPPSDFRHIKDVICPSSTSPNESCDIKNNSISDGVSVKDSAEEIAINVETQKLSFDLVKHSSPINTSVDAQMRLFSPNNSSVAMEWNEPTSTSTIEVQEDSQKSIASEMKWTRYQDKLILETCQRYGVSDDSFTLVMKTVEDRTIQQIQDRFYYLLSLFKEHKREISSDQDSEV